MSQKQANLLRTIFQDKNAANIHWRELESLLSRRQRFAQPQPLFREEPMPGRGCAI